MRIFKLILNKLKSIFVGLKSKNKSFKTKHFGLTYKCPYCNNYPYPLNYHEKGDCPT